MRWCAGMGCTTVLDEAGVEPFVTAIVSLPVVGELAGVSPGRVCCGIAVLPVEGGLDMICAEAEPASRAAAAMLPKIIERSFMENPSRIRRARIRALKSPPVSA